MPLILNTHKIATTSNATIQTPGKSINLFNLTAVSEQTKSRFTVYQTLGEAHEFFFGEEPRIFSYEACIFNTPNTKDLEDFQNFVFPTKKITLTYEKSVRIGIVLSSATKLRADELNVARIGFTIVITDYSTL